MGRGRRYRGCVALVEAALVRGATLAEIFGEVDTMKWRSSREVMGYSDRDYRAR